MSHLVALFTMREEQHRLAFGSLVSIGLGLIVMPMLIDLAEGNDLAQFLMRIAEGGFVFVAPAAAALSIVVLHFEMRRIRARLAAAAEKALG